jgi:hypothetical protein
MHCQRRCQCRCPRRCPRRCQHCRPQRCRHCCLPCSPALAWWRDLHLARSTWQQLPGGRRIFIRCAQRLAGNSRECAQLAHRDRERGDVHRGVCASWPVFGHRTAGRVSPAVDLWLVCMDARRTIELAAGCHSHATTHRCTCCSVVGGRVAAALARHVANTWRGTRATRRSARCRKPCRPIHDDTEVS